MLRGLVGDRKQFVWRAVEHAAERFDVFVAYRARFTVDHAVEVLIAHAHLAVEPIFGASLLGEQF